jgi:hypothetical protein
MEEKIVNIKNYCLVCAEVMSLEQKVMININNFTNVCVNEPHAAAGLSTCNSTTPRFS